MTSALLVGFGVTNRAVARALVRRGHDVVATDDRPTAALRAAAGEIGVSFVAAPTPEQLRDLVAAADAVVPSPGVPDHHPVFATAAATGTPVRSEFDLAGEWDDRPVVAITGTDGKTTVTTLVTAMLEASGRPRRGGRQHRDAAGGGRSTTPPSTCSSWRRRRSGWSTALASPLPSARGSTSRPTTSKHTRSLAAYERAKARIWRDQGPERRGRRERRRPGGDAMGPGVRRRPWSRSASMVATTTSTTTR